MDNECYNYGQWYCCGSSYRNCGDNYCLEKPSDYGPCWALYIVLWVFSGLGVVLVVGVFVLFLKAWFKWKASRYNIGNNYYQFGQYQPQPIIISQPQYQQIPHIQPVQPVQAVQPVQPVQAIRMNEAIKLNWSTSCDINTKKIDK